jgi:hypothetical protein
MRVPAFRTPINVAQRADIVDKYLQQTYVESSALTRAQQSWKLADREPMRLSMHIPADVIGLRLLPCRTQR